MSLPFVKMHGLGNDYVFVDGFRHEVPDPPALARRISDRHFGVGGDGLIIVRPPTTPGHDGRMEMYNADGSRAEMCGNGVRCVARLLLDGRPPSSRVLRVETDAGVKEIRPAPPPEGDATGELWFEVDMGAPGLRRADLPLVDGEDPDTPAIGVRVRVGGATRRLTAVSMGNPHVVLRIDEDPPPDGEGATLRSLPIESWGPELERHAWFPRRVNVEWIALRSRREIDLRVWERGSGETLACGTGACASVVAGVLRGWLDRDVIVHLRGGDLRIRWDGEDASGRVLMTGPATEAFRGVYPLA